MSPLSVTKNGEANPSLKKWVVGSHRRGRHQVLDKKKFGSESTWVNSSWFLTNLQILNIFSVTWEGWEIRAPGPGKTTGNYIKRLSSRSPYLFSKNIMILVVLLEASQATFWSTFGSVPLDHWNEMRPASWKKIVEFSAWRFFACEMRWEDVWQLLLPPSIHLFWFLLLYPSRINMSPEKFSNHHFFTGHKFKKKTNEKP